MSSVPMSLMIFKLIFNETNFFTIFQWFPDWFFSFKSPYLASFFHFRHLRFRHHLHLYFRMYSFVVTWYFSSNFVVSYAFNYLYYLNFIFTTGSVIIIIITITCINFSHLFFFLSFFHMCIFLSCLYFCCYSGLKVWNNQNNGYQVRIASLVYTCFLDRDQVGLGWEWS